MRRFPDRTARINRQRENRIFQQVIMPVSWLVGMAGATSIALFLVAYVFHGTWFREALGIFVTAASFPFLLSLVRLARGHFSRELDEP